MYPHSYKHLEQKFWDFEVVLHKLSRWR